MVELDVETDDNKVINVTPITINERNRVGESYFVDCKTGKRSVILPSGRASVQDIKNSWQKQDDKLNIRFSGRIGMPLLPSCPIDFKVNVLINPITRTFRIVGERDGFPAYEAYIQVDNNSPKSIFSYNPIPLGINPVSSDGLCMWGKSNPISSSGKF